MFLSNCALIRHSPIDLPILSCSSAAATASAGPTYAVLHILRGGRHNVLLGPVVVASLKLFWAEKEASLRPQGKTIHGTHVLPSINTIIIIIM